MLDRTCVHSVTKGKIINLNELQNTFSHLCLPLKTNAVPSLMKTKAIEISQEMAFPHIAKAYNSLNFEFTSIEYISRSHRMYVCV